MAKKSRKHAGTQHHQYQHQHQRRGPQGPAANTHFALTSNERHDNDEINAHLPERFKGSHRATEDAPSAPDDAQLPTQSEANTARIREYFRKSEVSVKDGNWLAKPEVPTPAEILDDPYDGQVKATAAPEELRPNKLEGAYSSNEEYLSTQYDLLREDSLRPLREAVAQVRASPYLDEAEYNAGSNIGLYEPVYITSIVFSPRGLATRIAFSLSRVKKFIRWQQSKRLITGTLVALSPADDCFQTKCVLATVAARPVSALEQNPPEIDLFFARPQDLEVDPMKKWIMVEARSSFYEASRHTMLALQHIMEEPFPLSEHLVDVQKHVEPPKYLLEKPHTDLTSLVAINDSDSFRHVNILKQWPDSQSHGLDKSQSQALHRILTNRLAIVQGPPGTGKTYVSVVALKILLANMKQGDPPIIVTCQTNHALDQLLRHAAEFETDFIRLGGRSKDRGKIKERTLYEVRMQTNQKNAVSKSRAMAAIRNLTKKMQMLLAPLEAKDSLLDHKVLQDLGLLTEKQADSIYMDALCTMGISADTAGVQMEQWIGKNLMPCSHPKQPDEIGDGAYEEEDFEVEQLQELEAEAVAQDDDDIEALPGPRTLLNDNVTGITTMPDDDIRQLLETDDLYTIPAKLRGAVYNYFLRQAKRIICAKFRQAARDYYRVVHERKIGQWEQDLTILSGQRLIGMTTTGLSKYRGLIAALQPKIVVVEEAAETLEAPVTAACLPSLEHLILVGDHQQLRPHCQVREFEDEPIHFNLSLFERMVANSLDMDCLTRQRRMIPEIRRLLEPIYGTTLKDHPSVTDASNRPPVEGMGGCNSFFFTHEWLESCDANKSAINDREASMVAGFFDYLVLNGVSPSKITVLTFYNGQRKMLSKKLALHPNLRAAPLKVVTVDSYQGEENDIVLLSLVRSNNKHKIGFLNVDNRVCVALSRARRGFYIFGNGEMLACESATWGDVVEIMYGKKSSANNPNKRRNVGYHLPLQCSNHGRKVWIEDPDDWDLINGGCDQKCGCALPCGHKCTLRCHPFNKSLINCTQKCQRRLEICGHQCSALCCDPCKCHICDSRHDGMRALLKPTAPLNGTRRPAAPQRPDPYPRQASIAAPQTSQLSGSSGVGDWLAYVNGGAKADDAEFLRKAKQENAKFVENMSVRLNQTRGSSTTALNSTTALRLFKTPSPFRPSTPAKATSPFKAPSPAKPSSTARTPKPPVTPEMKALRPGTMPSPHQALIELSPVKSRKAEGIPSPSKPLIELSPVKAIASSCNANLLIDLGADDSPLAAPPPPPQPTRTKNKKKKTPAASTRPLNLLD